MKHTHKKEQKSEFSPKIRVLSHPAVMALVDRLLGGDRGDSVTRRGLTAG